MSINNSSTKLRLIRTLLHTNITQLICSNKQKKKGRGVLPTCLGPSTKAHEQCANMYNRERLSSSQNSTPHKQNEEEKTKHHLTPQIKEHKKKSSNLTIDGNQQEDVTINHKNKQGRGIPQGAHNSGRGRENSEGRKEDGDFS